MYKNKRIIALIPARKGSKRIKSKNIYPVNGYPLVAYTLVASSMVKSIDKIYVSTDSNEIGEICKKYHTLVEIIKRPKAYATDSAGDNEWLAHALKKVEKDIGKDYYILHLRPTSPLRTNILIQDCIEIFYNLETKKLATSLRTIHEMKETPYKGFHLKNNYLKPLFKREKEYFNKPVQSLPKCYKTNGAVDILLPSLVKKGIQHGKKIYGHITEYISDIDTLEDIEYVQNKLNKHMYWHYEYLREFFYENTVRNI